MFIYSFIGIVLVLLFVLSFLIPLIIGFCISFYMVVDFVRGLKQYYDGDGNSKN